MYLVFVIHCLCLIAISSSGSDKTLRVIGRHSRNFAPFILGGRNVERGEFPFMVSIQHLDDDVFKHDCGGTVVSLKAIVTSAQCFHKSDNATDYMVRAGITNLYDEGGQNRTLKTFYKNPNYTEPKFGFDIAVAVTNDDFIFNEFVGPLKLTLSEPTEDMNCTVTGWGAIMQDGQYSPNLQVGILKIVNQQICEDLVEGIMKVHDMLCAGKTKSEGICTGDCGGPLMCNDLLYGIASFRISNCNEDVPSFFTNAYNYSKWVKGLAFAPETGYEGVPNSVISLIYLNVTNQVLMSIIISLWKNLNS